MMWSSIRRNGFRKASRLGLVLLMLAALITVTACGGSGAPGKGGEGKRGGTITVLGHHEVASLSPDDIGPTVHLVVIAQIHNALVEIDHNYDLEKVLAENYEVSADGLTYTFTLRKGVKFHDGTEFTSADVKYTFDYFGNPANAAVNGPLLSSVDRVETPDKHTVKVHLKQPDATFLRRGATIFIVPAAYHAKVGEKVYKTAPIGTGPFKVKEWKAEEYTLLEAFDDHFRGRPNADFFRMNIVPEPSVRAIALQTGQADSTVWPLLTEDNLKFEQDSKFKVYRTPSLAVNHFPLNTQLPQFQDKRVRQAMMHAIDRQRLIDDVFKGAAAVATSNLAPALKEYYEANVAKYPYDVARAKALLDEAGWKEGPGGVREKNGQKLTFTLTVISGDQVRKPEAEFVQQSLKAVGIQAEIREAPVATILAQLPKGELNASLFNWTYGGTGGEPDPFVTLHSTGARNFNNYKNPQLDKLIEDGLRETDVKKRQAIYSQVQKIVADEVPFLYICYWDWFNIFNARIKGLPQEAKSGDNIYRTAWQWWIE